ncbi:MAG: hypothetical protein HY324_03690, partial [Chlamydiia bacterium]|nr:hypothetical protein [Chlamydiia bacterium]
IVSLNSNQFWGIGLRSGADGAWNFWRNFSLFGKSGISLLAGQFNINQQQIVVGGPDFTVGSTYATAQAKRHQLATALDLAAGFGWNTPCWCVDLDLSIGWEFQCWFSQNQLLQVVSAGENSYVNLKGDLTTQGLIARVGIAY